MSKVVLITGASRGIGKTTALEFAKLGYRVVINYYEQREEALSLQQKIEEMYGLESLVIHADVSDELQVKDMVEKVLDKFGTIDVLVNNAGIAIDKEFEERTVEDWRETLGVNLIGPFLVAKYVGEVMCKQKSGKIVNISSTNGINTFYPSSIDYDASKAALINLTKNLAIQFAPYVNVNAVAPGWVNTEMNKKLPFDFVKEEEDKILLKRFADPEEIARVICFLSSDDASYIHGSVIVVDGGM